MTTLPLLVPLPLVLALLAESPSTNPRAALEQGASLRKRESFDEAVRLLEGAAKRETAGKLAAEIRLELGQALFQKGQAALQGKLEGVEPEPSLIAAIRVFEEIVAGYRELDEAGDAAYLVGSSHILLGDMERALRAYEKAYGDFPASKRRATALLRIGVCQAGVGEVEKARATFRKFLADHPADREARKVNQYLHQMQIVGSPAPRLAPRAWLHNVLPRGLDDLRGDVVVVVFFATWCENCKNELHHLKREMERWSREGVSFVGVADPDDPKAVSPIDFYVQSNAIDYLDVALDHGGRLAAAYRATSFPAVAIIDRKGIVRWRGHLTFLSHTLLERLLRE
jgi:tetratricopeptide (TPR) repeat protein